MKHNEIKLSNPETVLRHLACTWLHKVGVAALLCTVALAPSFAYDDVDREKVTPPLEPGMAIGDETIGTLPIFAGGSIELVRGLPIVRPSFFLEGDLLELQNAIAFFRGTARAAVVPLDPLWQRVRLVFVDEVMLGFDRVSLVGADIQTGLWIPAPVAYAYPNLSWGGRTFGLQPTESRIALPMSQMSATGALDVSPLFVQATGWGGSNALTAAVDQDFMFVVQRH
ncbi:MAG: hypothetical protein SGI72_16385 [Planctomycetota bacterium]|nr:hypothetical protein [Planctomycetota bacterium]